MATIPNILNHFNPKSWKPDTKHPMYPETTRAPKAELEDLEVMDNEVYLNYFENSFSSTVVKVYLDEDIKSPKYYRPVIQRISSLTENDYVHIIINSYGGSLDGCLTLINAIEKTAAQVHCDIEGMACSAGSIIALSSPSLGVGDFASIMIHPASFGSRGAQQSVISHSKYMDEEIRKLYFKVYEDFLTEQELQEVLIGREFWFNSEEINRRLEVRSQLQEKRLKKSIKEQQKQEKLLEKQ